ncbi:hypothetical protein B0T22DRAFT_388709 [Podospora appendiculata]|uniref:Centrosomin N-terminal motif 1 domain-containing protein n=1 Tax=Podospora appendiculata TaxID=314037 RepID=A0AAE1C713_9PEZI|nr:hypothetical protein B0T22DRAFT_388709 [Podospora appendiculata]
MDGFGTQNQVNDRSRYPPPPFPRTASRSSTSSTRTRQSTSSASNHQVPSAHPHRYHHSRCTRTPNMEQPRSQLSREPPEDSRQSLAPTMSSFLQERLERERKVESDRSSSRASNDGMSVSADSKPAQSSPSKTSIAESRRPRSSAGSEASKKKGLGLKEMEQTLSTLHKQNFDLKLELFHRRERQSTLEERLDKLETEKAQTDQMNDQLIQELEKRDKAVEEAVGMIVVLEARVEQLLREREMVRQVEQEGIFPTRPESPSPAVAPKMKFLQLPKLEEDKVLNRMPSFLSERSENTENLRNVYLGVRGSVLSLPPTAEESNETDRMNGISSPTLSVLSESSFLSVYGQKYNGSSPPANDSPPALDGGPPALDGAGRSRGPSIYHSERLRADAGTPTDHRRISASRGVASAPGHYQNINDVLDEGGSRLQRFEKIEKTMASTTDTSRPSTLTTDKYRYCPRPTQTQNQPRTKQEKRDALQRVLTQGSLGRDIPHHHRLPPTPDTVSTSTLYRYQNSNDTLSREQSLVNERSSLALSDTTYSQNSGSDGHGKRPQRPDETTQPASTTAFNSLKQQAGSENSSDTRFATFHLQRPRSASDTTVPRRIDSSWNNPGSGEETADGADSSASSFDPWLQESQKPNYPDALEPLSSVSQAGPGRKLGRISPDLFSFPMSTSGWATDAMFGPLGGTRYSGLASADMPSAPMASTMDAIGQSFPTPLFGSGLVTPTSAAGYTPPPPPDRRSSLHARTGSTTLMMGSGSIPSSPARPSSMASKFKKSPARVNRKRSNSIDVRPPTENMTETAARLDRAATVPPKQLYNLPPLRSDTQPPPLPLTKQRHYPPTASQQPRSRGLNSLFRRSTGSAEPPQLVTPSSAPPTQTEFEDLQPSTVGVPSWGRREPAFEDERESATPPPIMRSKGPGRAAGDHEDGGVPLLEHQEGAPIEVIPGSNAAQGGGTTTGNAGSAGLQGGGKRKWLGLGRVGSLRNRGAA